MRKETGSYRTNSILSITATLVQGFAVEDLPSGMTVGLVPKFTEKDLPLGRTL